MKRMEKMDRMDSMGDMGSMKGMDSGMKGRKPMMKKGMMEKPAMGKGPMRMEEGGEMMCCYDSDRSCMMNGMHMMGEMMMKDMMVMMHQKMESDWFQEKCMNCEGLSVMMKMKMEMRES